MEEVYERFSGTLSILRSSLKRLDEMTLETRIKLGIVREDIERWPNDSNLFTEEESLSNRLANIESARDLIESISLNSENASLAMRHPRPSAWRVREQPECVLKRRIFDSMDNIGLGENSVLPRPLRYGAHRPTCRICRREESDCFSLPSLYSNCQQIRKDLKTGSPAPCVCGNDNFDICSSCLSDHIIRRYIAYQENEREKKDWDKRYETGCLFPCPLCRGALCMWDIRRRINQFVHPFSSRAIASYDQASSSTDIQRIVRSLEELRNSLEKSTIVVDPSPELTRMDFSTTLPGLIPPAQFLPLPAPSQPPPPPASISTPMSIVDSRTVSARSAQATTSNTDIQSETLSIPEEMLTDLPPPSPAPLNDLSRQSDTMDGFTSLLSQTSHGQEEAATTTGSQEGEKQQQLLLPLVTMDQEGKSVVQYYQLGNTTPLSSFPPFASLAKGIVGGQGEPGKTTKDGKPKGTPRTCSACGVPGHYAKACRTYTREQLVERGFNF